MKKNFLFKGVSVLGAVLLVATSVMPGLQYVYAEPGDEPTAQLVYDLIYDEASWNAAYYKENSALKAYLDKYPDEDRWCSEANNGAGDYGWGMYKENGKWPDSCVQSWKGAINAPGATYPWAVINVPDGGLKGTITFEYTDKESVMPWGKHVTLGSFGIASIPGEFNDPSLKSNEAGVTSFDVSKFTINVIQEEFRNLSEEDGEWYYIYNETSWNAANTEGGPLYKYYTAYPSEDLWCSELSRFAGIGDKRIQATLYSDAEGQTEVATVTLQPSRHETWKVDKTERQPVIAKIITSSDNNYVSDTNYYFNGAAESADGAIYPLFTDEGFTSQVVGLYIKLNSEDYPGCIQSWEGAINAPGAKYPWIAVNFNEPTPFKIALKYKDNTDSNNPINRFSEPWGMNKVKEWGTASIPVELGMDFLEDTTNNTTSFKKDKLTVLLVTNEEAPAEIVKSTYPTYTITYTDGVEDVEILADQTTENVLVGSITPAAPDTTNLPAGYIFAGWNPEVADRVTADATYTATWDCDEGYHKVPSGACDSNESTYTVTWENENGTVLETDNNVEYDTTPSYDGATPTKASDSNYTYTFKGWKKGNTEVTIANEKVISDVTYVATYTAKSKTSYSGGGGGSSKKTETKEEDTKATTGDTAKVDDKKVDETKTDETKNDSDSEGNDGSKNPTTFSQEFKDAYKFAHDNGITTKDSIEEADMYGPLTRIAMAKMLSQYAINVLGKTPDTSIVVPAFPDVSAQLDADYDNGVTLAYQLGIMGIGIEKFRPFDLVTRAEFGTALSRMLFGLEDGEGNEWYSTHLAKLMEEQIITNDNPNLKELRGYVMIMLMRSAQ